MSALTQTAQNELQTVPTNVGEIANAYAKAAAFNAFTREKSANTLRTHKSALTTFSKYLSLVGVNVTGEQLQTTGTAWGGMTHGIVEGFKNWMFSNGFSVSSINNKLATVRIYAKLAKKTGHITIEEHIAIQEVRGFAHKSTKKINEKREQTRITKKGAKKSIATSVTIENAKSLKSQATDTPQAARDNFLMCILLDHGLRCGEAAILTVDNFDLTAGTFTFFRPKVNKTQTHKMTADTLLAFISYQPHMPESGLILRGSRKGGKLTGHNMTTQSITARVKTLGASIGVDRLSAHDCRHYWATDAAKNGTDINDLRQAGGWNSLAMPARYIEDAKISNDGVKLSS